MWGAETAGIRVRNPKEIPVIAPELVVVSNYNYSEEIYNDLVRQLDGRIPVVKLHHPRDVPWVF